MQTIAQKAIEQSAPYDKRFIRFVENIDVPEWEIKLYWISWKRESPDDTLLAKSKNIIEKRLAQVTNAFTHYNIGFAMIHEGKDGTYVIVSHWIEENMLDHIVLLIDDTQPGGYKRLEPNTIVTCVWELEVMYREKKFWIDHVLTNKDLSAYLNAHFQDNI